MVKINKQRRIIFTNNDFNEWQDCMINYEGLTEEEATYERYCDECDINLYDERSNLDVAVNGVIVAFAVLGLWDGKHNASKVIGCNVNKILSSDCDYVTWFCDPYNVRGEGIHHDGKNVILYRVAKDMETAKLLVDKIAYHDMTEEQFRKSTRSLRPYVAKVYGW